MLAALALTFLATTIGGLNAILDTVDLDGDQWRVCFIAVAGYFVLAELGKFILRRVQHDDGGPAIDASRIARKREPSEAESE